MLLIMGSDNDPNARRIADQAHIRSVPYRQLDPSVLKDFALQWSFDGAQILMEGEPFVPLALYLRHNVFSPESAELSYQLYATLQGYALAHPTLRLLNRRTNAGANNKCFNLGLAKRRGMTIPNSRVVTATGSIMDALSGSTENLVAKPLEGGDHTVPAHALNESFTPYRSVFVQERLPGRNIRQFVIDGRSYAFELKTTDLDYRTDPQVDVIQIALPDDTARAGEGLADALMFDYCAIDYRENANGEPVFLEINSFPMFSTFDNACDNALADAQLRFLCDGWFDYPD